MVSETIAFYMKHADLFPGTGALSKAAARALQPPQRGTPQQVDWAATEALQMQVKSWATEGGWTPPPYTTCDL